MSSLACIITCVVCSVLASVIATKITAAYYLKVINGFIENSLKQTEDLIRWAKGFRKESD